MKHLLATFCLLFVCLANGKPNKTLTLNNIPNPVHDAVVKLTSQEIEIKVDRLLKQLTLAEKVSLVHASGTFHVNAIPRLGIPELWLSDGPHGVRHQIQRNGWDADNSVDDYATYLPPLMAVAASWDENMAMLHGNVLGSEARARGKDIILGPGVNLTRLAVNGRNFEYMGEDPYLVSKLVVPEIMAIQAQDVAACVKHFVLNNQELNRSGVNAKPSERTLREVYLPAFEAAVKIAKVQSVMGAYNQYYGTNVNQSKYLVKDILKGEWGFNGVLLTDWNVDINTYDAAMNGLDLEMGTNVKDYNDYFFAKPLLSKIQKGEIPEHVLDDKVKRILRLMFNIGVFSDHRKQGERNTKAHQLAARKIAESGIVLLKNNPINNQAKLLPLSKSKLKNILVLGPNADKKHGNGGGSSEVKSPYEITPLQGLKNKLGDSVNITYMRIRSNKLNPIAPDYIKSRHWTGTPAWQVKFFKDAQHKVLESETWQVDSTFKPKFDHSPSLTHMTMRAEIQPLQTGKHQIRLNVQGKFQLLVNGKTILSGHSSKSNLRTHNITLSAKENYQFELRYDGEQGFTLGWETPSNLFVDQQSYLTAAKKADVVLYFAGLSHADDRESIDRHDLILPNDQDEVIEKLLKVNPNTVIFIVAGSAVEMPWIEQANVVVWGWYGGMEAGNAYANILFGDVNPSGKLPITLPQHFSDTAPIKLNDYNAKETLYKEGVFIGYRWFEQQKIAPLFEFGYGLSYTTFAYNNMKLSSNKLKNNDSLTVTATITNTGKVAGAEVVQLYLHDQQASVERPIKELKGFKKVFLNAGESKEVSFTLNKRDLSYWDENKHNWRAESGKFTVMLAASLSDIRLSQNFTYTEGL
jgi:beta-glucosidase